VLSVGDSIYRPSVDPGSDLGLADAAGLAIGLPTCCGVAGVLSTGLCARQRHGICPVGPLGHRIFMCDVADPETDRDRTASGQNGPGYTSTGLPKNARRRPTGGDKETILAVTSGSRTP
jgi:hypothetical protein